jgi:hypothetical protein
VIGTFIGHGHTRINRWWNIRRAEARKSRALIIEINPFLVSLRLEDQLLTGFTGLLGFNSVFTAKNTESLFLNHGTPETHGKVFNSPSAGKALMGHG